MESNRIQLSEKEILEKDFKTGMRGYNQEEVDKFLDTVIQDYEAFQQMAKELTDENERLTQENEQLRKQAPQQTRVRSSAPNHQVNYDMLRRLSNLEKAVFGKKYEETD